MQNDHTVGCWRKVDLSDHASDMLEILLEDFNQGRKTKLTESQLIAVLLSDAILTRFRDPRKVVPHAPQKRI
jgi:hypothetical protein